MKQPRFVGYVIANNDEEYLFDVQFSPGIAGKAWARHPDFARVFVTRGEAREMLARLHLDYPAWVLELYDAGSQHIVATPERNRPAWLLATA